MGAVPRAVPFFRLCALGSLTVLSVVQTAVVRLLDLGDMLRCLSYFGCDCRRRSADVAAVFAGLVFLAFLLAVVAVAAATLLAVVAVAVLRLLRLAA